MSRGRAVPPVAPDLSPHMRAAIAAAVHHAVITVIAQASDLHWPDGSGACGWYAATVARVAAAVAGRDYHINACTFQIQTSTREGGLGYEMNAADPLIPGQEFHAVAIGRLPSGERECIDLASRHWRTWAERLGAPWDAPDPPLFVWCRESEVRQAWPMGISYVAHVPSTQRLIALLQGEGRPVLDQMVLLASDHLRSQMT